MIKFRRDLIKFLNEQGIEKKSVSYTRAEDFDVVIVRENDIETMFFLHDDSDIAETITKKEIEVTDRNAILKELNILNTQYGLMNFSLLNDKICIRAWTMLDNDALYNAYQKNSKILAQLEKKIFT